MLMKNELRYKDKSRPKKATLMPKYSSYSKIKKPITANKRSWACKKKRKITRKLGNKTMTIYPKILAIR